VQHRTELINDSDFSILALYQAEYRGLVEYYRLAYNLHSLTELEGTMEISLTKTLAAKYRMSVPKVYKKYQATFQEGKQRYKVLQVLIEREGKKPLVARWGGISLHWDIQAPIKDHPCFLVQVDQSWKRGCSLTRVNTVVPQETPNASRCIISEH
jgi:Type II intron maturase